MALTHDSTLSCDTTGCRNRIRRQNSSEALSAHEASSRYRWTHEIDAFTGATIINRWYCPTCTKKRRDDAGND